MKKQNNKGNPLWQVLVEEWTYLGEHRKTFIFYMTLFTIAAIITLMIPLVVGLIFNTIQENADSGLNLKKLIFLISLLLVIDIFFWIFHGTGRILERRVGFLVHRNFINAKIKRVLELPVKWHKDNHSGDTIDKINRADESLGEFSKHVTFQLVYAIINIFGSLFILFLFDPLIASFALGLSLITLFIITRIDRRLTVYYKELNKYSNKVSASLFDYISNIFTVITLKLKKTVSKEIDSKIMDSFETQDKSNKLDEFKWAFATISISLMTVLALSYKVYTDYTTTGVILIGTLYIFYGYLGNVGRTFFSFAHLYGEIVRSHARIRNTQPIDDAFHEIEDEIKGNLPVDWKEIEIRDLDFKYEEDVNKKHLDKVNIKIKKGQKIALIGESGSGKSTILSVLRGLYPPKDGGVYYHDVKLIKGFSRLKHHITLIPQDPEIFNNTIGFNINIGLRTNKEEINKAIKIAQFENVVKRLDKGLETNVLERGVSLSGGEKQRLALARGVLAARNSDIVLMDEPTSSVDSINEMKIHDNIFKEFKGKTIISSIHRLHLLEKFDYIYMFENGKIIGEGTLKDIKKNPKFMRIWRKSILEDKKEK